MYNFLFKSTRHFFSYQYILFIYLYVKSVILYICYEMWRIANTFDIYIRLYAWYSYNKFRHMIVRNNPEGMYSFSTCLPPILQPSQEVWTLYMIPRFSFMPRPPIRIISHLHLSNKQVFKHSLKIFPTELKLKKKNSNIEFPYLDAIKGRSLPFNVPALSLTTHY